MKPIILTLLTFLSACAVLGQNQSTSTIKMQKMLRGLWVFSTDRHYSLVFSGDSVLQYYIGDTDPDAIELSKYEVKNGACGTILGKSHLCLIIQGSDEESSLCLPVEKINENVMILMISEDRMVELDKIL